MQVKSHRLTSKVRVRRHRHLFTGLLAVFPLQVLSQIEVVICYAVNVSSLV